MPISILYSLGKLEHIKHKLLNLHPVWFGRLHSTEREKEEREGEGGRGRGREGGREGVREGEGGRGRGRE